MSDDETPRQEQQAQILRDWIRRPGTFLTLNVMEALDAGAKALRELPALRQQLTEQRAELTGNLSDVFKSMPECYDTPVDHYREMARRLVEDRDVLKHRCREAEQQLTAARAEIAEYHMLSGESLDATKVGTEAIVTLTQEVDIARLRTIADVLQLIDDMIQASPSQENRR